MTEVSEEITNAGVLRLSTMDKFGVILSALRLHTSYAFSTLRSTPVLFRQRALSGALHSETIVPEALDERDQEWRRVA
jgi:hypothetical protein